MSYLHFSKYATSRAEAAFWSMGYETVVDNEKYIMFQHEDGKYSVVFDKELKIVESVYAPATVSEAIEIFAKENGWI